MHLTIPALGTVVASFQQYTGHEHLPATLASPLELREMGMGVGLDFQHQRLRTAPVHWLSMRKGLVGFSAPQEPRTAPGHPVSVPRLGGGSEGAEGEGLVC